LDANVLVSAVLSPGSTANLAYQKALDTGILLISVESLCGNVGFPFVNPTYKIGDRTLIRAKSIEFITVTPIFYIHCCQQLLFF
jgi:hypothetical protein